MQTTVFVSKKNVTTYGPFVVRFQTNLLSISKRLERHLRTKVTEPASAGRIGRRWTNNNCESINHVLKQAIEWKSKSLLDFTLSVSELVDSQFTDLRRALVGPGEYRLADDYSRFRVDKATWATKTADERNRLYRRFRLFSYKTKGVVTSTDGRTKVVEPRTLGKKIGQQKRKVNERTNTIKKKRNLD